MFEKLASSMSFLYITDKFGQEQLIHIDFPSQEVPDPHNARHYHPRSVTRFAVTRLLTILTLDDSGGRGGRLSEVVGGATRVGTRVLLLRVLHVESHEPEVVES